MYHTVTAVFRKVVVEYQHVIWVRGGSYPEDCPHLQR